MKPKLGLYKCILPLLETLSEMDEFKADPKKGTVDNNFFQEQLDDAQIATVFDCRQLPVGFVEDTGHVAFDEGEETRANVCLPFNYCYFEFSDEVGILATSTNWGITDIDTPDGASVDFKSYEKWSSWDRSDADRWASLNIDPVIGHFPNGVNKFPEQTEYSVQFFELINEGSEEAEKEARDRISRSARRLLGILTLLQEKYVAEEIELDPSPKVTKQRKKRGKPPTSGDARVLTVNVAAVRRASQRSNVIQLRPHESPCLHWRRGHWRILHRGSEFEGRAWVNRCLVGNPDKGFAGKSYKLVNNAPMLNPTNGPSVLG